MAAPSSNSPQGPLPPILPLAMDGVQRAVIETRNENGAQTPQSRLSSSNNNNSMNSDKASSSAPPPAAPTQMDGLHGSAPPPFLNKTYDMVEDSSTDKIVSWSPANNSFIVWNPPDFARDLLPKYFKHNNFSSFVRQLNTYGFRKVDPDRWEFANEGFLRGQRQLLKNIHRRKPTAQQQTPQQQQQQQAQSSNLAACVEVGKFGLEGEVERLKRDKNVLMAELVRLKLQQQSNERDLEVMAQRLQITEQRQQQMMAFLAKALHNPSFLAQLVQQNETNKRLATADRKRRRLPKQEIEDNAGTLDYDGQIVKYQPVPSDAARTKIMQIFNNTDINSRIDTSDNPFDALFANLGSPSAEQAEDNDPSNPSNRYQGVTLTEMQVCPSEQTCDLTSELPMRSLLPLPEDATRMDAEGELMLSDLNTSDTSPDVYSSVPAQNGNEGLTVSEVDPGMDDRAPLSTGTNDVFWEQFLTANPESPGTSSDEAETVESGEQQGDTESSNWWNKPTVDHLAERMGQLAPGQPENSVMGTDVKLLS